MTSPLRLAPALLALALVSAPLSAQQRFGRALSIAGGASYFDASGTGTAPMGVLRWEEPLVGRWLLSETGVGYARLAEQFRTSPTHLALLETQAQLQAPFTYFRPYVGIGVGMVSRLSNRGDHDVVEGSASVATGARIPLTETFGVRGELRVRGWGRHGFGFVNGAAESTFGASFAF